jgi:hypothetical protein
MWAQEPEKDEGRFAHAVSETARQPNSGDGLILIVPSSVSTSLPFVCTQL